MTNSIYFDNASTSYPKPPILASALSEYLHEAGCSPGRSSHSRGRKSEQYVTNARQRIADFLGCNEYRNIAYTYNATYALNLIIKGYLRKGDHVITTCLEHNSVLRPLEKLKRQGEIDYSVIGLDENGALDIAAYEKAFMPNTRLVVVTHASNVTGIINPVQSLVEIAHSKNSKLLLDISQTAGFLDIELEKWGVDFAAFTGHKALLGLPGIGGAYIRDSMDVDTIIEGGTGVNSISLVQPGYSPDKFEAGTCNYTGIVTLGASVEQLAQLNLSDIREHERQLLAHLTDDLRKNSKVTLFGDVDINTKVPVLSFTIDGLPANEASTLLDEKYQIMTRPGLQCAPLAHKEIGTSPTGTIRVSLGSQNTLKECDQFIRAITEMTGK